MKNNITQWFKLNHDFLKNKLNKIRYVNNRKKNNLPTHPFPNEVLESPYVFVLSTGRCGTGLITKILSRSSDLIVYHNPKPELEYVSSIVHQTNPQSKALELAVLAARFDYFVYAFQLSKTYVETNNRISFFAPALYTLCPNAKFIHLIRHPADYVRSGMRRGYYKPNNIQYQRLVPKANVEWDNMNRLEKIAWEWNEINSAIDKFKRNIEQNKIMTIKSEDLFEDPKTLSQIFEFINFSNPFKEETDQARKFIKKPVNEQKVGSYPKYTDWPEQDKTSLKNIATLAETYGYEL